MPSFVYLKICFVLYLTLSPLLPNLRLGNCAVLKAPALILTIIWELLNYLTQSAGNLFSLNFLGILRDYTSDFVFCNFFFNSSWVELIFFKGSLTKRTYIVNSNSFNFSFISDIVAIVLQLTAFFLRPVLLIASSALYIYTISYRVWYKKKLISKMGEQFTIIEYLWIILFIFTVCLT